MFKCLELQFYFICLIVLITKIRARKVHHMNSSNNLTNIPLGSSLEKAETSLCYYNPSGNYPNPLDCNAILTCLPNRTLLMGACEKGLHFDPFRDSCVYPDQSYCPWWPRHWIKYGNGDISCQRLGQPKWWSVLTIPIEQELEMLCGSNIIRCEHGVEKERAECPPYTGYSKAYVGCLYMDYCQAIDRFIFQNRS